jgi:2-polyprenyl-3-methyl-5-hydroxy-6-metoxy-1,4-benzoquinol methylase
MESNDQRIVPPAVYSEDYYLADNEGYKEYQKGLESNIHPKFGRALKHVKLHANMNVLDIGCGRGELSFYALKSGCKVTAVDYSEAAIRIARQTMASLSEDVRSRLDLRLLDATGLNGLHPDKAPANRFDVVFMVDVVEHVYPWQLQEIVLQLKRLMKPDGLLFISTPNGLHERYFYTVNRILSWPFTAFRMFFCLVRGKINSKDFFRNISKFSKHRNDAIDDMHVNVMSPREIQSYFPKWRVKVICDPGTTRSFMSILAPRWFAPELVVCAKPPRRSDL